MSARWGILLLLGWLGSGWSLPAWGALQSQRTPFSVKCGTRVWGYRVGTFTVLPNEQVEFEVLTADWQKPYVFAASLGPVKVVAERRWSWRAPSIPGTYTGHVRTTQGPGMDLNLIVLVPFSQVKDGWVQGYQIGNYPPARTLGEETYALPKGLIEVTAVNRELQVSPHFRLWQFESKQVGGYPKFLVLDEHLLGKLELLLKTMNDAGFRCSTLGISSGYRTPYYNLQVGESLYSSHQWGQAADIFIGLGRQGDMQDLNQDGKINGEDIKIFYHMLDRMDGSALYQDFVGGLGFYTRSRKHLPFIHVDVRGSVARWQRGSGRRR